MRQPTLPSRPLCTTDKRRQLAYKPAAATDIRATFKRARAEATRQLAAAQQLAAAGVAIDIDNVVVPAPASWLRRKG